MQNKKSNLALWLLFIVICAIRLAVFSHNELGWDVFGYYLYLPATFIHHDPLLRDPAWIQAVVSQYHISDTLYQVSQGPSGNTMYFFLMGMALLYAPFFLLAHAISLLTHHTADGFGSIYQYTLLSGFLLYTLVGLRYVRNILLSFFNDTITAAILIVLALGTNYLHFATIKNLETANVLFMLLALLVWNTMQWHREMKTLHMIGMALCCALITLIKPSEIVCGLIPLLWGVYDRGSVQKKLLLFLDKKGQVAIGILTGLLVFLPQLLYWKWATGSFIYDSYKNPGVGLDLSSPHIYKVLFGFRKGWLIYTPVMSLACIGFYFLYQRKRELFIAVFFYFLATFYIIASWTEWWYGAGYSIRPLVPSYALLVLPLGYTIEWMSELSFFRRSVLYAGVVFLVLLNLFQTWQFNQGIIDPYRTTKAYYFAVFGKTSIRPEDQKLLLIGRSFAGKDTLYDEENYIKRNIGFYDFNDPDAAVYKDCVYDSLRKNNVLRVSGPYDAPQVRTSYNGITKKHHAWLRSGVDIFIPADYNEALPCIVSTFSNEKGNYAYRALELDEKNVKRGQWTHLSLDYLTPEVRNPSDEFTSYVWHRGKKPIYIDNFKVDAFEPRYW